MRAVVFSDPQVSQMLNDEFVCAWVNVRPEKRFRCGSCSRIPDLEDGDAADNVASIFAGADGTVIHAVQGNLRVESFFRELWFAKYLVLEFLDRDGNFDNATTERFKRVHSDSIVTRAVPRCVRNAHAEFARTGLGTLDKFGVTKLKTNTQRVSGCPRVITHGGLQ